MKGSNRMALQVIILIGIFFFAFTMPTIVQKTWAQNSTIGNDGVVLYTTASKPYGLSYGDWTAKWWQWLAAIPSNINPASDNSGANCAKNQTGPVWFLTGSVTGKAERTCNIPAGKSILFTIINAECSYVEYPKFKTELGL